MKVFLVEVETLEPVVVSAKKGKTRFVEGLNYIPASSITGAIARRCVLNNIRNSVGKCSELEDTNRTPECEDCPENCLYRKIWIDKRFKVTNAVFGNWSFEKPGIPGLQSVGERRSGGRDKKDLLMFLFLERMFWCGDLKNDRFLEIFEEVKKEGFKKRALDFDGNGFGSAKVVRLTRTSVEEKLKTSKEGELYGFTAIAEKQNFRFMAIGDEELEEMFKGELKVGSWKSRGMGLVELKIVDSMGYERFVEKRSSEIIDGIERTSHLFSEFGLDGYFATYTYLTDGFNIPNFETVYSIERFRRLVRYERTARNSNFVLANTLSVGSVGVIRVGEPEKVSKTLAEHEIRFSKYPWFDWVFFNHPVHYEFGILRR